MTPTSDRSGSLSDPQPYDHVRPPDDADVLDGIYRVVGTGDPVVLLYVADADAHRQNTGDILRVSRPAFEQFHPAENPDRGLSLGQFLPPVGTWARALRYWLPF